MNETVVSLVDMQNKYEEWFNCSVCLCPKTRMIFGLCQHKVCEECLYDEDNSIRTALVFCPICQSLSFPASRPCVPQDNIEMMKCLGILKCPNNGCEVEVWPWELENHIQGCERRPEKQVLHKKHKSRRKEKTKPKILPSSWRRSHRHHRSGRLV